MLLGLAFEAVIAVSGVRGTLQTIADKGVYTALELLAVGLIGARVWRSRTDRLAWALVAGGLLAWSGGDLTWTVWLDGLRNPPSPSLADALYLAMFPATYLALGLLIRARLHQAGPPQWLDGAVVGLTAAAVAAALMFDPVLRALPAHVDAELVNLAYPIGDLGLLVLVGVACSLSGWRPGRGWSALGGAVALTAVADIVYAYETATGGYRSGTLLDVLWPASMALFAYAAWAPGRHQPGGPPQEAPHTVLVALLAAIAALSVLVVAAFTHVTATAVVLAAAALVLASLRAALTYLANVRALVRSSAQALTDPLSGLGNRRALMEDLGRTLAGGEITTLAFYDLDGFKRYNDSFGHRAGDVLLTRLGRALAERSAGHGVAYRLGGDEFCVLLRGRVARHDPVITAISSALGDSGTGFAVSASLGLAVLPDDAATADTALQLADERMYAEKATRAGAGRTPARDVLMQLLNERSPAPHDHVTRAGSLAAALAEHFELDAEALDEVLRAAELHDVGKLAIPDAILDKPGPLDDDEWRFMKEHAAIGERILSAAPALRPVARLVRSSHERWDGTGYPDALAGERIPLGARIVAVCDAFEAMTSDRCYRRARTPEAALAELRAHAGTQFDPAVVAAFARVIDAAVPLAAPLSPP